MWLLGDEQTAVYYITSDIHASNPALWLKICARYKCQTEFSKLTPENTRKVPYVATINKTAYIQALTLIYIRSHGTRWLHVYITYWGRQNAMSHNCYVSQSTSLAVLHHFNNMDPCNAAGLYMIKYYCDKTHSNWLCVQKSRQQKPQVISEKHYEMNIAFDH